MAERADELAVSLRTFAAALDADRGHSKSHLTRVMREPATALDALLAELEAATQEIEELRHPTLGTWIGTAPVWDPASGGGSDG